MDMALEKPDCPMCGSSQHKSRYEFDGQPYGVRACGACGFLFLSPRPTEAAMLALYSDDTYFEGDDGGYGSYESQEQPLRLTFRRLLHTLAREGRCGGDLLEVGCGYGYFLDEAEPFFDSRTGTDYSGDAVLRAAQTGATVYCGGTDQVPGDLRFDCIVSNHVIEHVYEPAAFVSDLASRLKPGGRLLLSTPHAGSFWLKIMGKRWPSFKLPEHVLYFKRPHLETLMNDAGLRNVCVVPYPHAFPLALVAAKLGISIKGALGNKSLWVPYTTLALCGEA